MKEQRHHAVHPVSSVKPNTNINKKPNYAPPERSLNVNPSLSGAVVVDAANARKPTALVAPERREGDDCDPAFDQCDDPSLDPEDRRKGRSSHFS